MTLFAEQSGTRIRAVEDTSVPCVVYIESGIADVERRCWKKHGFTNVEARRIPNRSPTPETYSGKWFKNAEELRDFKKIGALLLIAEKPH
jgi:hypothetical protein